MELGHEELYVCRLSIRYVTWATIKIELDRIAETLSRLGGRGYCVKEDATSYESANIDFDPDPDSDFDGNQNVSNTP